MACIIKTPYTLCCVSFENFLQVTSKALMFFFNKETLEDYISYKLLSVDALTWRCLRVPSSCSMVCEIKIPFTLCVSFNDMFKSGLEGFAF